MSDDPSGTGGNGADDPPQPPTGRWLGAVRSWIGGAEEGDAPASSGGGTAAAAPAAASPTLTAAEVRRRRLEKMEGSKSKQVREVTLSLHPLSQYCHNTLLSYYCTIILLCVDCCVAYCVGFICI